MFKHIFKTEQGYMCFDQYFAYINSVKKELGSELYAFASDIDRYNLTSKSSLHDAWLQSLTVNSNINESVYAIDTEVRLDLLGPFHDRMIYLNYFDVSGYSLNKPVQTTHNKPFDLLWHEIRITDDGRKEHAMMFDHDVQFIIAFSDMKVEEAFLCKPSNN